MIPIHRLNKIASLAILPLMALALVVGTRFTGNAATRAPMPTEGLLVIAQLRGEAITTYDLQAHSGANQLALPGPPHEFAFADGRLYVTLGRGNALLELEPSVPAVLRTLPLGGEPNGLQVSGDSLLATLDKANAMVSIDRATMTETNRVRTGNTPHNVAVTENEAYVTDSRDNQLQMISLDGAAAATGATQPTGTLPESVAITGDYVVTADADGGTITIVRRNPFETIGSMHLGGHPVRVIALDATHVAVALNNAAEVAVVDVGKHHIERRVPVLGHPDGMCTSPSGQYLAVSSNEAGAVQIFRRSDWALAGTLEAGNGPGACTWLPHH